MRIAYLFILLIFLASCNSSVNTPQLSGKWLNIPNLPSDIYEIDPNLDTVLYTRKGAVITIPKGSLSSKSGTNIKLEIREAYSISDMILAGLSTTTKGTTLSSGGMIYINVEEPGVTITKPILAEIPTDKKVPGMQVYKGIATDNGIDWVEPSAQPAKTHDYEKGKSIYMQNCASCHNPYKDATGPPLAYITQRRDWEWFKAFTRNSAKMIAEGDAYANCLFNKWNKTAMLAFPTLTESDFVALAHYLETYNKDFPPEKVPDNKKCFDECAAYYKKLEALEIRRKYLLYDNSALTKANKGNGPVEDMDKKLPGDVTDRVAISYARSEYYQVEVNAFGWYNIDIPAATVPGFEKSNITVEVTGAYQNNIELFIIIPEYKIFNPAGLLKGETNVYGFVSDNGDLPMVPNKQAYILAIGEQNQELAYSILPFTTAKKQRLSIALKATTKQAMNSAIAAIGIDKLQVDAKDAKNATEIRQIDAALEELKKNTPMGCNDCCGNYPQNETQTDSASTEMLQPRTIIR